MKGLKVLCLVSLVCLFWPLAVSAQEGGGGRGRGRRGGRMNWQNMTPEQRQQMMERMAKRREERNQRRIDALKEQLKPANDEEWQIIEMQIKEIYELRRDAGFRRFGRGWSGEQDPLAAAREELKKLTEQADAPVEQLKAAMAKYRELSQQREAEDKKRQEEAKQKLQGARAQLKSILTLRQEAILLHAGVLE